MDSVSIQTNKLSNSMEQSPWEADSHSTNQEIHRLYGIPRFITVFTTARHWARWIHSTTYHPISL